LNEKYQYFASLADQQSREITGSMEDWTKFLTTAGRLYKYPFEEQLLIHAQRPNATACANFDLWKDNMNRPVKRGSKGIALLDNTGSKPRLKYVYDVADTYQRERNAPRPIIWELKQEHKAHIIEALENAYSNQGVSDIDISDSVALANHMGDYLYGLAMSLSVRYYEANKADIIGLLQGSHLDNLSESDIDNAFTEALTVSTAYALMSRCGIDPQQHIQHEDFQPIFDFNSPTSVHALGRGVSIVTEDVLRKIEVTIKNFERQHSAEREVDNDRDNLHHTRGLSNTQHNNSRNAGSVRQVRNGAETLSPNTPRGIVYEFRSNGNAVSPLHGDRESSQPAVKADNEPTNGTVTTAEQGSRPDGLGGAYGQLESPSGGNDLQGTDSRLDSEKQNDIITNEEIDTHLQKGSNIENSKFRIYSFFLHDHSTAEKIDFLKNEYGWGGSGDINYDSKGFHIKKGSYFEPTAQTTLTWKTVAIRIDRLIADNRYMSEAELNHLPLFERERLGAVIIRFYDRLPEDISRPISFGNSADFWGEARKVGNMLDNPETVTAILSSMSSILETASDGDTGYESRKIAFNNLTAFENGTFTLFPSLEATQPDEMQATLSETQENSASHTQMTLDSFPVENEQINEPETTNITGLPLTKNLISTFTKDMSLHYAVDKDGYIAISNGYYIVKTNEQDIDKIAKFINGRRTKNKIEPVLTEKILERLEQASGNYELTQKPYELALDKTPFYFYADNKQYFQYNQKFVDIFDKSPEHQHLSLFVDDNTDYDILSHHMVVKNVDGAVLGIVLPARTPDYLYERLADALPLEVPYKSELERIKENPTNDPYIGKEYFNGVSTHVVASLRQHNGEYVYQVPNIESGGRISRFASLIKPEDMEAQISRWEANRERIEALKEASIIELQQEIAERIAYEFTHGFTDNLPPMQKGRVLTALDKSFRTDEYGSLSTKKFIEAALQDGKTIKSVKTLKNKYMDMNIDDYLREEVQQRGNYGSFPSSDNIAKVRQNLRNALNEPDNPENEYAIPLKENHPFLHYRIFGDIGVLPPEFLQPDYRLVMKENTFYQINKTAHDYGKYLTDNKIFAEVSPEQSIEAATPEPAIVEQEAENSTLDDTADLDIFVLEYAVGDLVYLKNDTPFMIEGISDGEVQLRELLSTYLPVYVNMPVDTFEQEYYQNPKNAEMPAIMENSDRPIENEDNSERPTYSARPIYDKHLEVKEQYPDHIVIVKAGDSWAHLYGDDSAFITANLGVGTIGVNIDGVAVTRSILAEQDVDSHIKRLNAIGKNVVYINSYGAIAEYLGTDNAEPTLTKEQKELQAQHIKVIAEIPQDTLQSAYDRYLLAKVQYPDRMLLSDTGEFVVVFENNAEYASNFLDYPAVSRSINGLEVSLIGVADKKLDAFVDEVSQAGRDMVFINTRGKMTEYSSKSQSAQETTLESAEAEFMPSATTAIADFVKLKLESGEKFSSAELYAEATKVYGDTMANNAFTPKDAYDAMELGVNQYMLSVDNLSPENVLKTLELLPTQTRRTAEMEKYQQFSTPPSIAYLANWAANINENDIMLEPSAGIGGIAVFAKKDGAKVYVNELDKRRLEIIKNLPFDGFFNEDAEQINNIHGNKLEPTVIVMNPPFSSSAERNIHDTKIGAKHIEQSLKMLAPNGRLVAIVGQGMADDAPAFRSWWREIKEQYNVKANIGIDGKNYSKYGTTFGVQMLVIDKAGATTEPVKTAFVENLLDVQDILEGVRNGRPSIQYENDSRNEQNPITTARIDAVSEGEPEHKPNEFVSDTGGRTNTSVSGDRPEQTVTPEVSTVSSGTPEPIPESANINNDGLAPDIYGERYNGNDGRNDVNNGTRRTGTIDNGQSAGSIEQRVKPPKPVKKELTDSIFENYEPQRLLLENVQPHPANISESAAMSAIQPPTVTYKPNLSQDIIDNGILSDVQLEAVTYAGQSHSQILPNGNTRGFFLGDGTGVGKGRTITGVILDNYTQGRKKAVWLSENKGLVPDAKRDVKALFGNSDLVKEFEGGKKADKSLGNDEAILFATYSALSKGFDQSGSNFEKIVDWLGKDFDGVIVFDEAHNMANSTASKGKRGIKKASQRGMAGLAIQEALPNAKIIYSSATGATEVENLRYAERLGLWGEGTAFPNGDNFVHRIKAGGLAAMELIARDMKAMGVYLSRNISYEDVVYDKIVHELTPEQRKIYDELARSWQIVLQNLNKALETTNQDLDGMAKGKAYGAFWSAEQRFFNQILTAMQIPSMITDIQKQLDNDNSVVIQLVSTNESAQEREFSRLQEQGLDLEDFDLTPKQMLMSYIENSFPTTQFEEYKDENGNTRSKPVYDSEGNAVINREAVMQKEMLLDKLGSIKVPASALDMIINHFGSDMVAENTGRKRRVVIKDGKAKEENIAHKKQADVSAFQDGDKRIIVFSKAGGTGKSYHADKSAKNQQHRVHYLLQAGWQADAAVQGFGRSHRSNQVSSPTFALVTTDLKGQMRFISTIAKRLDQLGALTKGQRQTGSQGLFNAGDNLENAFAADVLASFYKALAQNAVSGISDGVAIIEKLGLKDKLLNEYGEIIYGADELREVNKFLNRILSLECHEQNAVFDGYAERLHIATEKAMRDGTLDKGLENYRADKVVLNESHDISSDEATGATTKYYNLTAFDKIKPLQFSAINTQDSAFMGFYQSKNTGTVRAVFKTSSMTDEDGNVYDNCRLTGQDGNQYMPQNRIVNNWDKLTDEAAEELWNKEITELPEFRKSNLHLIGGAVLPVWDKLPTENVRIYRVLTSDDDMLIGRVIPEDMIDATLRRLGATREKENIETADLVKHIKNGDTVHLDNDWRIVQRRVSNEQRIEVIGADFLHSDLLNKKGVFTERIGYQTRYFIPVEKDTIRILDEVIKISPVSRVSMAERNNDRTAVKSNAARGKPSLLETLERNAEKSKAMFGDKPTAEQPKNKTRQESL